mmetsp:Transcript_17393/g.41576  ORF Transcript_17393/g.41576 Transcript_17393/m.41576 type:complete len:343 (-) Transcript_17393:703-1731(-)
MALRRLPAAGTEAAAAVHAVPRRRRGHEAHGQRQVVPPGVRPLDLGAVHRPVQAGGDHKHGQDILRSGQADLRALQAALRRLHPVQCRPQVLHLLPRPVRRQRRAVPRGAREEAGPGRRPPAAGCRGCGPGGAERARAPALLPAAQPPRDCHPDGRQAGDRARGLAQPLRRDQQEATEIHAQHGEELRPGNRNARLPERPEAVRAACVQRRLRARHAVQPDAPPWAPRARCPRGPVQQAGVRGPAAPRRHRADRPSDSATAGSVHRPLPELPSGNARPRRCGWRRRRGRRRRAPTRRRCAVGGGAPRSAAGVRPPRCGPGQVCHPRVGGLLQGAAPARRYGC